MKNAILCFAASLLSLIIGPSSLAQITVNLTTESWAPLLANTPGQTRQIHVSGGGNVWGMDFRIQVEDGFPDGPGRDGPNIPNVESAVDITTGTIFATGDTGTFVPANNGEQFAFRSVTVNPGPVSAAGLLATITFDTTGMSSADSFAIKVAGTLGGDTQFFDSTGNNVLPATLVNGSISMVPEPISTIPVAAVLLGTGWFLRRRRSA